MYEQKLVPVSLPIVVSREKKWFVAACPPLDIATQGKTEKEVRENMRDLIREYFADPDTVKPSFEDLSKSSIVLENMSVNVRVIRGRSASAKSK